MGRVATIDGWAVSVYAEGGGQHHLPHCHVWKDDDEAVLALPTLLKITGDDLPPRIKRKLAEIVDCICDAWDELNPNNPMK
jgi:hypothetical protein